MILPKFVCCYPTRKSLTNYLTMTVAQQGGNQAVLSQTVSTLGSATGPDHGQASVLRGGESRDHAWHRTSPAQGSQQSGRGVASAYTTARESDGPLQVTWSATTLLVGPRSNRSHVLPKAPPPFRRSVSPIPLNFLRSLECIH